MAAEKKDILFEVCAPKSKKVLIYAERVLGQVRVHAIDSDKGDIDLGGINDIWRENDNAQADLRQVKKLLNLKEDQSIAVATSILIKKINELVGLINLK